MVQMHLRHFRFGMKCRHKNKRTIRFVSTEVKKDSCKAPLVYRIEAQKHYNIEVVKQNPYLIKNHIQ